MRITNSMMRTNSLWSINRNEELMNKYETQLNTGKKIQKPSDNPIVAVRALKFRTNVKEIAQYKTNSQDGVSWLNVSEQAISNSVDLLKRARDLCVQGSSDIFSSDDRASIVSELEQLKSQLVNEANVNYAGRYVFSGYKTNIPVTFTKEQTSDNYLITEHLDSKNMEKISKVVETTPGAYEIREVNRLRLGYGDSDAIGGITALGTAPNDLTITTMNSTDADAYEPAEGTVHFLKDTGELIFNTENVNGVDALGNPVPPVPGTFDFEYNKASYIKGDRVPELYFDCTNTTKTLTYTKPNDVMSYQISYNQDVTVNTMGNQVFTTDLIRDFDEIIDAVKDIKDDDSIQESLQKDVLGSFFSGMLTKLDKHINTMVREEAVIGSKTNRLELTINRLNDDKINFTELLSINEDVDMTEAVLSLKAQEIVYNAALSSSAMLMQKSLLDFMS